MPDSLQLSSQTVPLIIVRNSRARRYLLRLSPNGHVRLTIPRGGSLVIAGQFLERYRGWLEEQFQKWQKRPQRNRDWQVGSVILLRGEPTTIYSDQPGQIRLSTEVLAIKDSNANLRPTIERHLRQWAANELPSRVFELAAQHGLIVNRVTIRNQRTRWGSCSRRGTISLNWRLIQTPDFVRDYIILHELAHLRHMNHSDHFWREVERLCPEYRRAEAWLKQQRGWLHE